MKTMKILEIGLLSALALSLAGCGKNESPNGVAANPYGPYANGQYAGQPFNCQAGAIQLRNAFGQPQCFPNLTIADACNQIGGILSQGSLCRKERSIPGRFSGAFYNSGAMAPDNIPLNVNLFPGESVKVFGTITSRSGDSVYWNAQLIQQGMSLGSASGTTSRNSKTANLSITAAASSTMVYGQPGQPGYVQPGYQAGYPQTGYPQTGYPQAGYPQPGYNQPGYPQVGYTTGLYNSGMYTQPATPNQFILQLMFEGTVRVRLEATAISCEDGQGNSYPCQ